MTFQYQALCYARDTWAYYDTHPGAALRIMDFLIRLHPPLRKYDVDGNRAVNETEYQAMRDAHDAEPDQFLQLALQQYARETCFAPGNLPPGKIIVFPTTSLVTKRSVDESRTFGYKC